MAAGTSCSRQEAVGESDAGRLLICCPRANTEPLRTGVILAAARRARIACRSARPSHAYSAGCVVPARAKMMAAAGIELLAAIVALRSLPAAPPLFTPA